MGKLGCLDFTLVMASAGASLSHINDIKKGFHDPLPPALAVLVCSECGERKNTT